MRIVGVAFSRLDIPGGSKRQRSEPACTCGGGKLGETRTELVVRFWPIPVSQEQPLSLEKSIGPAWVKGTGRHAVNDFLAGKAPDYRRQSNTGVHCANIRADHLG